MLMPDKSWAWEEAERKPCPFCGSTKLRMNANLPPNKEQYWVSCNGCAATGPWDKVSAVEAGRAWAGERRQHSESRCVAEFDGPVPLSADYYGKLVVQPWLGKLSFMQQAVLLTAIRGPDGIRKDHPAKLWNKWLRRCLLYAAFERQIFTDPWQPGGGSFTGPWASDVTYAFATKEFFRCIDELPHHFTMHVVHAAEILGYKHPEPSVKEPWLQLYHDSCKLFHMLGETEEQLDKRLGDSEFQWRAHDPLKGAL